MSGNDSDSGSDHQPRGKARRRPGPQKAQLPEPVLPARKPVTGVGRHKNSHYDPVTGEKRRKK